jgi:diguanylate cyclase (GGDEF)-like protein
MKEEHVSTSPGDRLASLEQEVESLRSALWLLHRVATLVCASPEIEATCYAVLTAATARVGLGYDRAMLFLPDGRRRTLLRGAAAVGPDCADDADRVRRAIETDAADLEALYEAGLRQRASVGRLDARVRAAAIEIEGRSPVALALRRGTPLVGEGEDDCGGLLDIPTCIAAPVRGRHEILGVLYADNRLTRRPIDATSQLVFTMVADHAGRALETAAQYERLAREARTDALTGLPHHGVLMADLAREVEVSAASGEPLGFVMLDLDDFKKINDRHGHPAGDTLLAGVAVRLRGVVRARERIYRYGGEEFAMLIPGGDRAAVSLVGGRLHGAVSAQPFDLGAGCVVRVTCSAGGASFPDDASDASGLVAVADAALLRAKARGKDRLELAWAG